LPFATINTLSAIIVIMDSEDAAHLQEKLHEQEELIENLEKELTRLKHKEQLVNEYAGSMHDKLQQKDEVIATKERRIEFLEGEVLHLQDTLAGARDAMRVASLPVQADVTTGIKGDNGTTPSTEDFVHKQPSLNMASSGSYIKDSSATVASGSGSSGSGNRGKSMMTRLRGCMPTLGAVLVPKLPKHVHLYVGGLIALVAVVAVVASVVSQMGEGSGGGGFGDEDEMGF
jgi:hypothetical protein